MPDPTVAEQAQILANEFLTWVGFGTCTGLTAKAIMPGRDPGGAIATVLMGVGGCIIGGGTLMYFTGGEKVQPISLMGFATATGGAFVLLFFYRLLGGRVISEDGTGTRYNLTPNLLKRKRRKGTTIVVED